ncbi:hypothetical protein [Microvirga sp. TS319]|uniref:hypothetical protein n=1 Tax=Microvirga sp. TS319 TaxID=3241165 RepID=UPI00351A12D4
MNCPCEPLWFIADELAEGAAAEGLVAEGGTADEEPVAPGCIAGEPDVAEPEPVAAGRSVGAEGEI